MQAFRDMGYKFGIAGELLTFLWQRKLWFMIPIVFVLLVLGLLIGFGSATGIGPGLYTLF